MMQTWLLPEYIEDILPPEARRIEGLRRKLLDLFHVHGYQQVIPPLMEYLPSLLTGTGHDMDLKTLKVVDQLSGRMMGLRADITPQAARIDAHLLNLEGVVRLCYAGSVLHALPEGMMQTREPLQVGAELFGHGGLESDVEIQQLMLKALKAIGVADVHLDLGHVGIFQALMKRGKVGADLESALFQALQGKDVSTLKELGAGLDNEIRAAVLQLPQLYGGPEILDRARECLPADEGIARALADLRTIGAKLVALVGDGIAYDLGELRGYHYHSGVVFAAYLPGQAQAVAKGGRYDEVGSVFGRARPATGFSMDLRILCRALGPAAAVPGILAPHGDEQELLDTIERLRGEGEVVVVDLPGHESHREQLNCDRRLVQRDGKWQVEKI